MADQQQRFAALRDRLIEAGHLVPMGADGLYGRSRTFEQLVAGLEELVRSADPAVDREVTFPPLLPRAVLERAGYLRSFPDMVGVLSTFGGGNPEHVALMQALETEPASDAALCSAACHPLYASLHGSALAAPTTTQLTGWVFRHEPSVDPARMQAFRQRESVYVGTPDGALAHRDAWLSRATTIFADLGLAVEAIVANDPFFGRVGRVLASVQRESAAKWELVFPIAGDEPTAIASANLHGDHFGEAFDITVGGGVAHTACVGFGVERVAVAIMVRHGMNPAGWPSALVAR
jgi:seryl-tRNA synthetase